MPGMFSYSKTAVERAMKIQEVILRAMARKITWWQAAEILGFSDRHLRRIRERYEEFGYESMFDKRRGRPSPKRVPFATVEKVLALYGEKYFDLNVRHFHEKLGEQHAIALSYPCCNGLCSSDVHLGLESLQGSLVQPDQTTAGSIQVSDQRNDQRDCDREKYQR